MKVPAPSIDISSKECYLLSSLFFFQFHESELIFSWAKHVFLFYSFNRRVCCLFIIILQNPYKDYSHHQVKPWVMKQRSFHKSETMSTSDFYLLCLSLADPDWKKESITHWLKKMQSLKNTKLSEHSWDWRNILLCH